VVVSAACSHSVTVVPVGPTDASDGGIRAAKNCVAEGGGLNPRPEDSPLSVQP
jgi:hypothetical protein